MKASMLLYQGRKVLAQLLSPVPTRAIAFAILSLLTLVACDSSSDPNDEGGVIGTGVILRGTASENRLFASAQIDIKANTGERSSGRISAGSRFFADTVAGQGPWLLRTDLGNGEYRFGIAFDEQTANVHSYSDVVLRNWFAQRNIDIVSAFNTADALSMVPSQTEFQAASTLLFSLFSAVLESYAVTGDQLLFESFDADDTGIDRYLDNNPVVIDGLTITALLTDPITQTQSSTRSLLALDSNLENQDLQPPKTVGSVRALGSSSDQVVVIWDPAEDNVGISSYEVYRDGVLLNLTPYPVFTDTGLPSASQFSYEIVAVDIAGNVSDRSVAVSATTLGSPDVQAPPAPTILTELQATTSRVDLIWAQSDIGDVVRFNIYRGINPGALGLLLRVTSTIMTDASVAGNTQYCYQVSAEDASGNESPRSDVLCINTSGAAAAGTDNGVPELAGLTIPDIAALNCAATLTAASITQDTTLSEPCYLVQQSIVVKQFSTLTLPAGLVLKFAQNTRLHIEEGASLVVNGLPESPVVLTGQESIPGFWEGVYIDRSNNPINLIRNSVIEFAGGGELNAALTVYSSVGEKTRIRVENSLFRYSLRYGISFAREGTVIGAFEGNVMTQNNKPAAIILPLLRDFTAPNDFSGNDQQIIDVARYPADKDTLIPDLGVPLSSNGMTITNARLTIDAGVEIRFLIDASVQIAGELVAQGTPDKPITLTALTPSPGQWNGINLSNSKDSSMENVLVNYAGGADGALRLNCSQSAPAAIAIDNSEFSNSASWGIFLDENGCSLSLGDNVQFNNNILGNINLP